MILERSETVPQQEYPVELINEEIFVFPHNSHKSFVAVGHSLTDSLRLTNNVRMLSEFSESPIFTSSMGKDLWLIRGEGIEFHGLENPFKTGNDSDAIYLATAKLERGFLLVQYLPPMSRTSHHWHKDIEIFANSGELLIWRNQKEVVPVKGLVRLESGESHIGFTTEKPAITYIYQTGKELIHEPLQKPSQKFLLQQAQQVGLYKAA